MVLEDAGEYNKSIYSILDDPFIVVEGLSQNINDAYEEKGIAYCAGYVVGGYDIIPIAETDYEDYICLYYKESREKPSVAYLNYELAMEGDSEAVQVLYGSLSELLCKLK